SLGVDSAGKITTSVEGVLPHFTLHFDAATALIALLNDPATLLAGLEGFSNGTDSLASGLNSVDIPLIGEPLQSLATSIGGFRVDVLGHKTGATYSDGLGKFLQDAAASHQSTAEAVLGAVRQAIFDGLS